MNAGNLRLKRLMFTALHYDKTQQSICFSESNLNRYIPNIQRSQEQPIEKRFRLVAIILKK